MFHKTFYLKRIQLDSTSITGYIFPTPLNLPHTYQAIERLLFFKFVNGSNFAAS